LQEFSRDRHFETLRVANVTFGMWDHRLRLRREITFSIESERSQDAAHGGGSRLGGDGGRLRFNLARLLRVRRGTSHPPDAAASQRLVAVVPVMFPVLVTLLPLLLRKQAERIIAAIAIGAFVFVSGFSIGMFYLPAGILMLLTACVDDSARLRDLW